MNHPELLAVPALMLADYVLTILGAKSAAVVYRKHIVIPTYEMNPLWRRSVDQLRWFNPFHLAGVFLIALALVLLDRAKFMPTGALELMAGMLFGAFGGVCGRHLTNLLLFGYLNRHPQYISGEVQYSIKLVLKISQYQYIGCLPLLALLAVLLPHPYSVGVFLGLCTLVFAHVLWGIRANRMEPQLKAPA